MADGQFQSEVLSRRGAIAAVAAGAIILALPSLLNGRPFVFPDTAMYLGFGSIITHLDPTQIWWNTFGAGRHISLPEDLTGEARRLAASHMAARSLPYAAFLTVATALVGIYGVLAIQCAITSTVVWKLVRRITGQVPGLGVFALTVAALTFLTPLGVTANLILPDAYTAPMIVLLALLFDRTGPMGAIRMAGYAAALAVVMAFHTSHLVIGVGTCIVALVLGAWMGRSVDRRAGLQRVAVMTSAVALSLVATVIFTNLATSRMAQPLHRPPIFAARVIDDGPGRAILTIGCARAEYAICSDARVLLDGGPRSGDAFLWADKVSTGGVYLLASPAHQEALRREEPRFVMAAIKSAPLQQVLGSVKNAAMLLFKYRIDVNYSNFSFSYNFYHTTRWLVGGDMLLASLPNMDGCRTNPDKICGKVPLHLLTYVYYPVILVSILGLCGMAVATRLGKPGARRLTFDWGAGSVFVLMSGVLVNDVVCAVLSGPYDRYQTRVIWLICLVPLLIGVKMWRQRRMADLAEGRLSAAA
jgi:hypothetical protein